MVLEKQVTDDLNESMNMDVGLEDKNNCSAGSQLEDSYGDAKNSQYKTTRG